MKSRLVGWSMALAALLAPPQARPSEHQAIAEATTSDWPRTPGAVKPTLSAPSLLMAAPKMTARIVSPSASASDRRLSRSWPASVTV